MINDPLDCSDVICTPNVTNTLLPILEIVLSELHDTQFTKVKSVSWFNLPFERAYRYLERERIAKAVLFLYTKIVAVFPYTVVRTPEPLIMEEKKVRMRWR